MGPDCGRPRVRFHIPVLLQAPLPSGRRLRRRTWPRRGGAGHTPTKGVPTGRGKTTPLNGKGNHEAVICAHVRNGKLGTHPGAAGPPLRAQRVRQKHTPMGWEGPTKFHSPAVGAKTLQICQVVPKVIEGRQLPSHRGPATGMACGPEESSPPRGADSSRGSTEPISVRRATKDKPPPHPRPCGGAGARSPQTPHPG